MYCHFVVTRQTAAQWSPDEPDEGRPGFSQSADPTLKRGTPEKADVHYETRG